ncbi:nuclear transport factor 2 family protein [Kribbella endophytica]
MTATEHTRTVAERYFSTMNARAWSDFGALLTDDVRYELPQTGEQITGRDTYLRFNQDYPGDWQFRVTRLIADGGTASATLLFTVGEQQLVAVVFLELRDGLVARITDFWPEPYDAPPGRDHLTEQAVSDQDRFVS